MILDIYDDPKGRILRDKVAGFGGMPPKLASSHLLDAEELARLPDRMFAMVAENHGQTIRKYAMHDASHLTTSLLYFEECQGLLPEATRQKVASNLIIGCGWHDTRPPNSLIKTALVGGLLNGAMAIQGAREIKSGIRNSIKEGNERMGVLHGIQASGGRTGR